MVLTSSEIIEKNGTQVGSAFARRVGMVPG